MKTKVTKKKTIKIDKKTKDKTAKDKTINKKGNKMNEVQLKDE